MSTSARSSTASCTSSAPAANGAPSRRTSRRARSKPDRRHHRQPERQGRRKRGCRIDPSGYDAGKKVNGKKRHILVDTQGLLMRAIIHAADVRDRDGRALLMATLFGAFPFLTRLFADGGYQGPQ